MGKVLRDMIMELNREVAKKEGHVHIFRSCQFIVRFNKNKLEYRLITAPLLTLNTSLQTSVANNVMTMNNF